MSYTNVQSLLTYLSTAVGGAPATTALAMIQALTPVFFNFTGDTTPHYGVGTPTAINTLASTQSKFSALLFPSSGTPNGITMGDCIGLVFEAVKDNAAKAPITLTAVSGAGGTVTVNLTSFGLTATPIVQLQPINPGGNTNAIVANPTALSSTSLSILCQQSQNILLGIINPFAPVSGVTVGIAIFPQ